MTNYPQLEQQFATDLLSASDLKRSLGDGLDPAFQALVDAIPYYGDLDWNTAFRGTLVNLLAVSLPNDKIQPQPDDGGFGYYSSYYYSGPYSGYRDAFFNGIGQTAAAAAVATAVVNVNNGLNSGWWSNYSVAVLTDAVRQNTGIALDTGSLAGSLAGYAQGLQPALTAAYLAVFKSAYAPTANALAAIANAGKTNQAYTDLRTGILSGEFTGNLNQALGMGGDTTNAAIWFLYNLWVTLAALGSPSVDADIQAAQAAGLQVPAQLQPSNWWNGAYTSWYGPLGGADVAPFALGTIAAAMPENVWTAFASDPPIPPSESSTSAANGYAQSLCYWGDLNRFMPPPSSCFGTGTGVLMADGSTRNIEDVRSGDEVQTQHGPRRVALVESPPRLGRALYQVNDLRLYVTGGHPLRTAVEEGPLRVAIDPWTTMDTVPTMTGKGVAAIQVGTVLSGESGRILVESIREHPAVDADEKVYDLLLENWERDHPTFFVGGPHQFVAADAEAVDPMYDLPSALGIVAALEAALPSCREKLANPGQQLLAHVASLPHGVTMSTADATRPSIPGPDFYTVDGKWDPHASMLETHLVRRFGRALRREAATGWQPSSGAGGLEITVFDLELRGEVQVSGPVVVRLVIRGPGIPGGAVAEVRSAPDAEISWHLRLDQTLRFPAPGNKAFLTGTVHFGEASVANFHVSLDAALGGIPAEPFLMAESGEVIGRIAIGVRSGGELTGLAKREGRDLAVARGRALGEQLAAGLAKGSSGPALH